MKHVWKSSNLKWHPGEDGCPVCRFLDDPAFASHSDLMEVIKTLDQSLARSQQAFESLLARTIAGRKSSNLTLEE